MRTIRNTRPFVFSGLLLAVLLLMGCDRQKDAGAPPQPPPPEVGVLSIKPRQIVLTTELPGRTAPRLIAEVRPQVGGIIQKRLFTEGSDVKAGDPLYRIDPAVYRAVYASAKAALARAEANLAPLRLKEQRFRDLLEINALSQQEYDDVDAALKQAEAEVAAARAALEKARIDLDHTAVKAPISGRIGRSSVTTGALVEAEQEKSLATIQQLDPMYVDVTQSSAELLELKRNLASGLLKKGGPQQAEVRLLLEDGTPYPFPGTLKFSEAMVDPSTGSVTLRTVFPNPDGTLLPGMYVRAILQEGNMEQAILVPQRGVTRNPVGKAMVMIVGAEEKVESRVIQVSRTLGDDWLVSSGLEAGDRVILEGLQRARPETVVRAVPFGPPPAAPPPAAAK